MEIAMRFDLVDLQLFIAVAEARSITGGALRSHLALASASARIKSLEAGLGTALLKRGRRGIELTAAGESLLDHARIILHNVDAMRGDLSAYASGARASVHLLANTSGLSEHLPKALAAFLREHPDINVDIEIPLPLVFEDLNDLRARGAVGVVEDRQVRETLTIEEARVGK